MQKYALVGRVMPQSSMLCSKWWFPVLVQRQTSLHKPLFANDQRSEEGNWIIQVKEKECKFLQVNHHSAMMCEPTIFSNNGTDLLNSVRTISHCNKITLTVDFYYSQQNLHITLVVFFLCVCACLSVS